MAIMMTITKIMTKMIVRILSRDQFSRRGPMGASAHEHLT